MSGPDIVTWVARDSSRVRCFNTGPRRHRSSFEYKGRGFDRVRGAEISLILLYLSELKCLLLNRDSLSLNLTL